MTSSKGHAIVLGGSISGLLAARVLTDHFDRVTIIEKDKLATGLEPRKTAPQGAHAHALLSRGRMIIEALFPGVTGELVAGGATLAGIKDFRVYVLGWRKVFDDRAHHCDDAPVLRKHARATHPRSEQGRRP